MSSRNIELSIAGRKYPITVTETEYEKVLNAEKKVQQQFAKFKKQYGISDPQDLLAMTALELATQSLKSSETILSSSEIEKLENKFDEILSMLG